MSTEELSEKFFNSAALSLEETGWSYRHVSHDGGSISTRTAPCGQGQLVRIRLPVQSNDAWKDPNSYFVRAEVIASLPHLASDRFLTRFGELVQLVEPGHAMLWMRNADNLNYNRFLDTQHVLLAQSEQMCLGELLRSSNDEMHLSRIVKRSDFPVPGVCCLFVSPEFEQGRCLNALQPRLWIIKHSKVQNMLDLDMVLYQPYGTFGPWTKPHFDKLIVQGKQFGQLVANSQIMDTLREHEKDFYLVINLKRCTYGPPLLPALPTGSSDVAVDVGAHRGLSAWVQHVGTNNFKLSEYLQALVRRIGLEDLKVFGSIDGRRLVPYQAAVVKQSWEAAHHCIREAFDIQQAAYRRLHKGKAAPELHFGKEPRFLPAEDADRSIHDAAATPSAKLLDQLTIPMKVSVRNTFIEVTEDDESDFAPGFSQPRRSMESYC